MTAESPEYVNSPNHEVDGDTLKVNLYDANQGKLPRDGGPYLDEIEREQAEILRAKREGREPDLDNPPPSTGTVLVTKSQLTERSTDKSHYADTVEVVNGPVASYEAEKPVHEADPTQPDWDNDMSKVTALEAGLKMEQLKSETKSSDGPVAEESVSVEDDEDTTYNV